jgi:hypothetical protein
VIVLLILLFNPTAQVMSNNSIHCDCVPALFEEWTLLYIYYIVAAHTDTIF